MVMHSPFMIDEKDCNECGTIISTRREKNVKEKL